MTIRLFGWRPFAGPNRFSPPPTNSEHRSFRSPAIRIRESVFKSPLAWAIFRRTTASRRSFKLRSPTRPIPGPDARWRHRWRTYPARSSNECSRRPFPPSSSPRDENLSANWPRLPRQRKKWIAPTRSWQALSIVVTGQSSNPAPLRPYLALPRDFAAAGRRCRKCYGAFAKRLQLAKPILRRSSQTPHTRHKPRMGPRPIASGRFDCCGSRLIRRLDCRLRISWPAVSHNRYD